MKLRCGRKSTERQAVEKKGHEGGYIVLKKKNKYIAVCTAGINVDGIADTLRAIDKYAGQFQYKILYFNSFSSLYHFEKHDVGESNIFHLINYGMIDGIILLADTIKNNTVRQEILDRARHHGVPVVSVDQKNEGCYNIIFRYKNAMRKIVNHLVEEHHFTRINFIAGIKGESFSEERLQAYKEVLEEHGIPYQEERIGYGNYWGEPAKGVMENFFASDLPFPEAIVCANDTMAIEVIKLLREKGYQVPGDVAVTGFDGIREALEHVPSITTVRHDYDALGLQALQILNDYFEGREVKNPCWMDLVPCYLESCGCQTMEEGIGSNLARELYDQLDIWQRFSRSQIALAADLIDNDSFQGIFENLKNYEEYFYAERFWLCIVDDFLTQKENLMDIIEESTFKRMGYSSTMNIMLSKNRSEWMGLIDFPTEYMLPNLEQILEEEKNVMFLPLHVLEQTVGYIALVYDPDRMNLNFIYQFFMNISNALETTRNHQRQQAIIDNLERKYVHDPMTGLYNRRGFYQRLEPVFDTCRQDGKLLMVASVDLNGLKQINDTYGHADGDIAISTIGKALEFVADSDWTCARFGGDEFVVSGQVDSEEQVVGKFQQVKEYLDKFNEESGKPYEVSASIGFVTGIPEKEISLDEFIKAADEKMYEDKVRYHSRSR